MGEITKWCWVMERPHPQKTWVMERPHPQKTWVIERPHPQAVRPNRAGARAGPEVVSAADRLVARTDALCMGDVTNLERLCRI